MWLVDTIRDYFVNDRGGKSDRVVIDPESLEQFEQELPQPELGYHLMCMRRVMLALEEWLVTARVHLPYRESVLYHIAVIKNSVEMIEQLFRGSGSDQAHKAKTERDNP